MSLYASKELAGSQGAGGVSRRCGLRDSTALLESNTFGQRFTFRHRDGERSTMRPDIADERASCLGWFPMVPHQVVGNRVEQPRAV